MIRYHAHVKIKEKKTLPVQRAQYITSTEIVSGVVNQGEKSLENCLNKVYCRSLNRNEN